VTLVLIGVRVNYNKKGEIMKNIKEELESAGYEYAVAIATEAEVNAGAACGQLAIIEEE
jgi:adenine C2-methylase RlmN of 23S rRNA A2503 and tRNA A37